MPANKIDVAEIDDLEENKYAGTQDPQENIMMIDTT